MNSQQKVGGDWRFRRVEKFNKEELLVAAATLTDIFLESAIFIYAFPNLAKRKYALKQLFIASLKDAEKFGIIEIIEREKILSIFIYYPPNKYPMSARRVVRCLPYYLNLIAVSFRGVFRLYKIQKFLDSIRPKTPHCHALFLGSIGNGKYGALLIRKSLETIDANRWPVYLETQDPRTTKLYSRHGSKVITTAEGALPGTPSTWTMWRDPIR